MHGIGEVRRMDVLSALEKQAKRLEESIAACEVGGSYADVAILHDRLTRCIELYADLIDSEYPVRHRSFTEARIDS